MKTYKLFKTKNGKLYPLYVEAQREMPIGQWLKSRVGKKVDDKHVKASGCGGSLRLRSGFHSTKIPFTDWIGKKLDDGTLIQRKNTVWCECEVEGVEIEPKTYNGYDVIPDGTYYYYKTNSRQKSPWVISDKIKINKVLNENEVAFICTQNGVVPQRKEI